MSFDASRLYEGFEPGKYRINPTARAAEDLLKENKGKNAEAAEEESSIDPDDIIKRLRVEFPHVSVKSARLEVDYGQPFEKMIKGGTFDNVVPEISATNYPLKGRGKTEHQLYWITFCKFITTKEIEAKIGELGLEPADLADLVALARDYPEEHRTHNIVALGSSSFSGRFRRVPELYENGGGGRWLSTCEANPESKFGGGLYPSFLCRMKVEAE